MRLVTIATTAALSASLLSGCSFITGNSGKHNPYAKQKTAHHGQYGAQSVANRCQIYTRRQPIPKGCRPEQVTLATAPQGQYRQAQAAQGQYGAHPSGFPQQPQFGQPQYTSGAYGTAVNQAYDVSGKTASGPKYKKPKLRGSLSLGVEKSLSGNLLDYGIADDINPIALYNPQDYNEGRTTGSEADGLVSDIIYTANDISVADIYTPNSFESSTTPTVSFDDVWSTPASVKAGLEYIAGKNTTVFVNGGYTHAEGNAGQGAAVTATLYQDTISQAYVPAVDAMGTEIPGVFNPSGAASRNIAFIPNQEIARFNYNFSDLRQYDLEIGARHYLSPLTKASNPQSVTPFIGASVGASHVNAVDLSVTQTQAFYERTFNGETEGNFYTVPTADNSRRLYDAQWLPQGQLNIGAEWQVTPGFALAAETGVKVQSAREYADFTNAAGDVISGERGDANVSIPFTLRGSVNF